MSHRVRTLIPHLDYGLLTKNKILPKEKLFTSKTVPSRGGKTPCVKLSKTLGASSYGILVEDIINTLLQNKCDLQSLEIVRSELSFDLQKYLKIDEWKCVRDLIHNHFPVAPQIQVELVDGQIEGHPDLLSEDCVYDIKTTGRFGVMRTSTIFQLLSYYCLCQSTKLKVTKIGLVLPLQNLIVTYDLSKWRWRPFYEELKKTITLKHEKDAGWGITIFDQLSFMALVKKHVGSHCRIENLHEYTKVLPALQFFLSGNQTSKIKYTEKFVKDTKNAIEINKVPVFIHSPYILNLSHPGKGQGTREEDHHSYEKYDYGGWTFKCLDDIFQFAKKTNIKGVVIHCGKRCGEEYYACVFRMWCSVLYCARFATEECKLIIETSSGQGGEILCSPEELGNFYLSLPDETRKHVGVCVDTCHTFSSGYDPYEFIAILYSMDVPIDLIHYNDSAVKKGAKKDRHERIGKGYIGFESLYKVLEFAIEHNIPLVRE
jgi:deoxyribonuclease-4